MKKNRVIYYKDELSDEFSSAQIKPISIDENYIYDRKTKGKILHTFCYKIIARPLAYIFLKIKFGHKIINKEVLKGYSDKGIFIYGNHTNAAADAFIPSMVSFPKDTYVIVHPNNVSMPVLGKITPYLGAVPLPGNKEAFVNFTDIIEKRLDEKDSIVIYPEAHIWPYYTKIRPFKDMSFRYPAQYHAPVFCFTNVYRKRKLRKTPQMITYIDGPFIADSSIPIKEQKVYLRNKVYDAMTARSKNNNVEIIKYIRLENE